MRVYDYVMENIWEKKDKIAIDADGITYSYGQVNDMVAEYRACFRENGVKEGSHVALFIENSVEYIIAMLAISSCGACCIPIDVSMSVTRLQNVLNNYDTTFVVTSLQYSKDLVDGLGGCKNIFLVHGTEVKLIANGVEKDAENYRNKDLAFLLSTSGTTSLPKGVMLSNENIICNIDSIESYLKLTSKDRLLLIKNFTHSSSVTGEILLGIRCGATLFITSKMITASLILDKIEKDKITLLFAVPYLLSQIIHNRRFDSMMVKSIRCINFYGGKISDKLLGEVMEGFPHANVIFSYGLTEASPRVSYIEKQDIVRKMGSSGKAIKGVEISIHQASEENYGEICVQGKNVMLGYYKQPEETAKKLVDGVLHTGDYGYIDEDGFLYVLGRKDNMIIQAGKNIYPEEVEEVIFRVKGVKDVCVYGVLDEKIGEIIAADIVMDSQNESKTDIILECKRRLESYKIPRRIHFVEMIPKNNNGKTIRRKNHDGQRDSD